ncbi:MAG TPA: glycosyltransferase family 4 protein [Mycobacteriales bacterium]|nr:glycosyltransferase family 4 protein [Mycobacteriales bacterium]
MRIALVGARSHPARHGGIERAVEELARELVARGHEVTVLVADVAGEPGTGGPAVRRVASLPGKYSKALSQAFASVLHVPARRFDVVHVHGVGPGIVIPLLKARRLRVVLTVHALDFERDKWPGPAKRVFRGLSRAGVRGADRVVVVAEHLREAVRDLYGVDAHVVHNGVTTPAVDPALPAVTELGLAPGSYALFVGRLVPEKRVEVLLTAHAGLQPEVPLLVVGSGQGSYAGEYEQSLRDVSRGDVRFLGQQSHDVVCQLVQGAAVLVNPSALEGLPLTVLEARALGTPVVLSDIAPHRELAGPSTALFPVDDVPALTAALHEVLRDAAARQASARGEQADVTAAFSWGAVTERTLELYREAAR